MSKIASVHDGNVPMLSDVASLVQNNPLIPAKERNRKSALVRKAERWFKINAARAARVEAGPGPMPETIPFTRQHLAVAFARLTIAHLDVSEKSVKNTLSDLNGIADLLGMPRGFAFEALNSACKAVQDRLVTHEDRGSCIRLLRVMSAHDVPIGRVADAVPLLRAQIDADWKVKNKNREFKRTLYAWNKAARTFPDLALPLIDVPKVRKVWGLRWSDKLAALEASIDACLALGDPTTAGDDIFARKAARPLGVRTKIGLKESARMVASSLYRAGARELAHVHDICRPEPYKTALRVLVERAGGVTTSVMRYATDVRRIGQIPGVLCPSEREGINSAYEILRVKHVQFKRDAVEAGRSVDRDQRLLGRLDDAAAMDAYLSLAHKEAETVRRSRAPYTVGNAYRLARALTLEIWHTVSWRIGVAVGWRLDQFVEVVVDGEDRILVRAPKDQALNKRTPDQFLSPEAATLYRLFIADYRSIILRHNKCASDTPYLFPGKEGRRRHPHTMRTQMNNWIRKRTKLEEFHPHGIRKINPKLILDEDPTAIELAVRSGGWADDRMLRKIYGQKQHQKSQLKINEFVVGRRLRAISTVRTPKQRRAGKKPPEAA